MAQEPDKKPSIEIIKFSAVELPKFVEKSDKDWVYYGLKNDYPYYLLSLYNKSNKHRAVVDGKLKYIYGKGWTIDPKGLSMLALAQYTALMQSVNEAGEDVDEVTRKAMLDWLIFGGFALEVIWNKAGTKVVSIAHVPFKDVRKKKQTEDSPDPKFYYTSEWYKTTQGGTKSINQNPQEADDFAEFEPFNPDEPSKDPQLFYYTSYSPDMQAYPLPEYVGKIAYIEIDIGISTFWNSLLKRGFTASHIITFMAGANATEELKAQVKDKLTALFGGAFSDEAGGFVVEFANDKDHSATVNTLQPTDMDKQYDLLNKTTEQEILMGINPMLFGIKTEGQLGGRTEIIEANELFHNTYVQHKQNEFEQAINWVFKLMGFDNKLKLTTLEPIGIDITNANIWSILTDSEKRERLGLKVVKDDSSRTGELIDKISTLSPLVANKVIESMSASEIRSIVGLPPLSTNNPIVSTTVTASSKFKSDRPFEIPTEIFEGLGEPADDWEELFSVPLEDGKDLLTQENEIFAKFQAFAKKLDSNQVAILDMLDKDRSTPPEMIAKVIKKDVPYVQETIKTLTKGGYITDSGISKKGGDVVKRSDVKTEDIFIKYSYSVSPVAPPLKAGGQSRPFCKFMTDENRLYTREEIDTIATNKLKSKTEFLEAYGDLPINIWEHRGGWYRREGSTVSVPQCRHVWKGGVFRKK